MTNRAEPSGADALFGEEMTCPRRTVQGDPIFLLLVRSCSSTEQMENIFPKDCHKNDPGSLIGEFFSWARRWRGTKCPPTFSAGPACGVWSRQRRTCRDDLARKKPAVLRQKRLWSLTSPLLSTSSLKAWNGSSLSTCIVRQLIPVAVQVR